MRPSVNNYPSPSRISVASIKVDSFLVPEYTKILIRESPYNQHGNPFAAPYTDGDWGSDPNAWDAAPPIRYRTSPLAVGNPSLARAATPPQSAIDRSAPISFEIKNLSSEPIKDVFLFDANLSFMLPAPNYGNNESISIISGVHGTTYLQILANSISCPFKVGETAVILEPGRKMKTLSVEQRAWDMRGYHSYSMFLNSTPRDYVNEGTSQYEYAVDSLTRIVINEIEAGEVIRVYMFLTKRYSAMNLARGGNSILIHLKQRRR